MDDDARRELDRDVARLADGDRAPLARVFALLRPVVVTYCRRLVGPVDAEDVAHLSLEKAFARVADYDPSRSALTWVLALATWECRTARTRRRRARESPLEAAGDPSSASAGPEDAMADQELFHAALEAMGTLTAGDRETLREAYWHERGAPRDAASRKRKERALVRLREAWRRLYGW